jgi:predicted kinase
LIQSLTAQTQRPIILLIGLPGSGKSTWAAGFISLNPDYRVVSTDATRAALYGNEATQGDWQTIWRVIQQDLRQWIGQIDQDLVQGVVFDATNARRRYRRRLIQYLMQLGYSPIGAIWFDVPLADCLRRNAQRSRQVPEPVLQRMHRQLEGGVPSVAEGLDFLVRWR